MLERLRIPALALMAVCLGPLAVHAQDTTELLNRMKAMEERIKSLEAEVQTLKGEQAATTAALTAVPSTPAASPDRSSPASGFWAAARFFVAAMPSTG